MSTHGNSTHGCDGPTDDGAAPDSLAAAVAVPLGKPLKVEGSIVRSDVIPEAPESVGDLPGGPQFRPSHVSTESGGDAARVTDGPPSVPRKDTAVVLAGGLDSPRLSMD